MSFQTLRLHEMTRAYGRAVAVDRLSLDISAGEFVALLGPSGCGKSTALNCLAGLQPLTAGSIWLDDQRVDGLPAERRDFGMVFQNYALLPHLTVRRNIAFGLVMRRLPKPTVAERVDEALRMVQLTGHADKYPRQLSGGQQQRVAIARAIAMRPRLILMDEPLSNLDAQLRLDMRAEIQGLHRTLGLTTIYVTHDQEEALALADRLVILRDGVTQQIGSPEEVYGRPANRYVAGFMGYRNMLAVEAAASEQDEVRLRAPGLDLVGRCAAAGRVTPGPVIAAFRPDDVRLSDDGPADSGNRIAVVVDTVEYRGRGFAIGARTTGGQRLWLGAERKVVAGEALEVVVARSRTLVFPVEVASPATSVQEA